MMVANVSTLAEKLGRQRLDDLTLGVNERLRRSQAVPEIPLSVPQKALLIRNSKQLDFTLEADDFAPVRFECKKVTLGGKPTGRRGKLAPLKCYSALKHGFLPSSAERTITCPCTKRLTRGYSYKISVDSGDLSSSSDDEVHELLKYSKTNHFKQMPKERNTDELMRSEPEQSAVKPSAISTTANLSMGEKDCRRKRNKSCYGNLKKRRKFSRPSLDLEKMLTTQIKNKIENNRPERGFFPINKK